MAEQRDFSYVTRIWVSVLTIFGLTTITQDENSTYKISYPKIIHSSLVCILLCVVFYYQILLFISFKDDFSTIALRCYVYCSGNFVCIILIILIIKNAKNTAELLSEVIAFNRKYRWDVYMSIRFFLSWVSSGIFMLLNFSIDVFMVGYRSDGKWFGENFKFVILGYIFPVFTFITVGQISFQMKWLDIYLGKFIETLETFDSSKAFLIKEISFKKFHSQMWQDELKIRELIQLRSIYHQIYHLSKKINRANSDRYILTIGQNFIMGTLYMYLALFSLFNPTKSTGHIPWVSYFRWSVCSYIAILTIIYPCQSIADQARKTVSAVQALRLRTNKAKLMNELENFLIQLMEEKIEFSAHGFFHINNGLLLSLLNAASSYLVILIQSRISIE